MSIGNTLLKAAIKLIGRAGGSYTYKRAASSMAVTGRVGILSNAQKFQWFTATETSTWDAPAYAMVVAGDFQPFGSEPTTGDSILLTNFSGTNVPYDVMRWDKQRIGGIVVKTTLFLERH